MKKIMSILGIAALAISLLSSGCSGEKTIKIGAILPLSGPLASIGKDIKFAIDIAVNDVNANGGIRNKPVQVFFEDSLGIPENGIAAFEKLRQEKGVKVIIGAVSSEVTLALAPYAERYELPIVSPTSSSPRITTQGNDYVFRVYPSDTIEARRIADTMFSQLFIRKFVPIAIKNEYGFGISNEVLRIARNTESMDIPEVIRYSPDSTYEDFMRFAEKIKEMDPEAVLLCGYPEDAAQMLRALSEAEVDCFKFSTSSATYTDAIQAIGEPAVGLIYAKPLFNPKSTDEATRAFVNEFVSMVGKEPDVYAAHGFDALQIAAKAFSKSSRPDDILRRLQQVKGYKGVAGDLTFDKFGDVVKFPKIFRVRVDEEGKIIGTLLTEDDEKEIKDTVLGVTM